MRTGPVAFLLAMAIAGVASAEPILVGDQLAVRDSNVERPTRGMTMTAVEARFGTPADRHAAVGKPPITRWDYGDFSVFFEFDRVVHAVALH